jgi:exopolyphosphatase / guanosine-5'-triphosphate,3'-diphosphate pyrophosphatase
MSAMSFLQQVGVLLTKNTDRYTDMVSAVIDVGSNTLRLLIGRFVGNRITRIFSDRRITRLAEGVRETGRLRHDNMVRSLSVLEDFVRSITQHNATRIRALGTSALREAWNSKEFITNVYEKTGISIDSISGLREAELTAKGVLLDFRNPMQRSLIIDIGGGSTEWILCGKDMTPLMSNSIPVGVVNLHESFITSDPASKRNVDSLEGEIDRWIMSVHSHIFHDLAAPVTLLGTGGTITTLAAIDLSLEHYVHEKVHMHTIALKRLLDIRDLLLSLPLEERGKVRGLERGREDLIIPGILLTIRWCDLLGFREIVVSDYGLLEGILKEIRDEEGF